MSTLHRPLIALVIILSSCTHAPVRTRAVSEGRGRTNAVAAAARREPPPSNSNPGSNEPTSLRLITKVNFYVGDFYVDPERIRPREMLLAALKSVEKTAPNTVVVEGDAGTGTLRVTVNGTTRHVDVARVDSLWKVSFTMKDVFPFIANGRPAEEVQRMAYAAIDGMLSTLDPQSVLIRPDEYRRLRVIIHEAGATGLVVRQREGNLTVAKVRSGSPAAAAGIRTGDRLLRIGDTSTADLPLTEVASRLRGPVGSTVALTVSRKGWKRARVITLTHDSVYVQRVESRLLAGNVGYVRPSGFQGDAPGHIGYQRDTSQHIRAALQRMHQEAGKGGLVGLVLDLRGNSGGLYEQAIQVADLFLSEGPIVTTIAISRKAPGVREDTAKPDEGDTRYPVVVLVDANSASGAELVAGALKSRNRAVVIGRRTAGADSVLTVYELGDDVALKLSVAKFLLPGNVLIEGIGIVPDVELAPTLLTREPVSAEQAAARHEGMPILEEPAARVRYLTDAAPRFGEDASGELDPEVIESDKDDFEIRFARDFLLKAPSIEREAMLRMGGDFVERARREADERINAATGASGTDGNPGPARPPSPSR